MNASAQPLPLEGIRVVEFSHFLAGPYIGRCLAALGAGVIKVERPPMGDAGRGHPHFIGGQSGFYLQQNMGKEGLCVDLKDARGLELVHRLVATADVFVENFRPGALDRLGLGYAQIAQRQPALVYCSVSAYGHTGPNRDRPGFGVIAEAMSGAMAMVGSPGEAPPLLRIPIADMYAGVHGLSAICAALLGRVRTGRGRHIDIALYDCMLAMHDYAVQCYTLSGGTEIAAPTGSDLPQSTVYGVFPARDGYLAITAQVDDSWRRLARLVGGDELAADARFHGPQGRNAHREEILARVRAWTLAQPSTADCIAALEAAAIPCAPVRRIDEALADPQTAARRMVIEQEHPVLGKIRLGNLPFRLSDSDTTPRTPAPLLGEHNRAIARRLGYADAEVDALVAAGVLHAEEAVARMQ